MTDFTKAYSGYRYANTNRGDTLPLIAYRELGDASKWDVLLWLNDLIPPFITDDPDVAGARVLLTGSPIKIPSTAVESDAAVDNAANVLLADVSLVGGRLQVDSSTGDLAVVSGRDNLKQALANRIGTEPGELIYHPDYGCKIHKRKGAKNTATMTLVGRMDVQEALAQENRLKVINSITVTSDGDALIANADVTPISGDSVTTTVSV